MEKYIVTNGKQYIRQVKNRFEKTTKRDTALIFNSKIDANILCLSCLPTALKKGFYVEVLNPKENENSTKTVETSKKEYEYVIQDEYSIKHNKNIMKWYNKLLNLDNLFQEVSSRKQEVISDLSTTQEKLNDLDHYTETKKLNACDGYKIDRLKHILRVNRRALKEELELLKIILSYDKMENDINRLINGTKVFVENQRTYKPRVYIDLFSKGIIPTEKLNVEVQK